VTELAHNDNNGAWYGLFGNMGVQIRLLGAKCGWNLFFPLALLLKPNISVNKTKDAFFFVYFILFIFRLCLQGACELQSDKYKGLQMHCKE
jgi:hypothetical protein